LPIYATHQGQGAADLWMSRRKARIEVEGTAEQSQGIVKSTARFRKQTKPVGHNGSVRGELLGPIEELFSLREVRPWIEDEVDTPHDALSRGPNKCRNQVRLPSQRLLELRQSFDDIFRRRSAQLRGEA